MPSRPTPHWSISAWACASASSVVMSSWSRSCVYTTTSAFDWASIASMISSARSRAAGLNSSAVS